MTKIYQYWNTNTGQIIKVWLQLYALDEKIQFVDTITLIIISGENNLTTGHIATTHGLFNGIRKETSVCIPCNHHASLSSPESSTHTASQSVQLFLHSSWQSVPILYIGLPLPPSKLPYPQNYPFPWWNWTPIQYMVPWAHSSPQPKQHLNRFSTSAVIAGLITVTDWHTDWQTNRPGYSVCNNRPHLA